MNPEKQVGSRQSAQTDYDVVIVGGAFCGASLGLLLRRRSPELRVLMVERSSLFERKVGEATVEVSALFLHRILGLYDHLSREHLPKHGLRYWFTDSDDRSLHEMTEVGPAEMPALPSFQLDRPTLDQHLLERVEAEGAEVWRPGKVKAVDFDWPCHRVTVEHGSEQRQVTTRWVVDASGRQAFLARKLGLHHRTEAHPTAAVWGRWTGVADLDDIQLSGADARSPLLPPIVASRRLATNHFCGYGWWCWVIPLANGNTSIGVVYNKDLFELPAGKTVKEQYERFVRSRPGLRQLVAEAVLDDDFMALRHLPYRSEKYMDLGWALVGDAASFIDPYYSPGLDHAAISIYSTLELLERDLGDPGIDETELVREIARHNKDFEVSYHQWWGALYDGKYEILGDAELTRCAFLMDTGLYYAAVVSSIERDLSSLTNPMFGNIPPSKVAHHSMRWFNQRLLKLARFRRRAGTYGRANVGRRHLSKAFKTGPAAAVRPIATALSIWLKIELERMWYRLRHGKVDDSSPVSPSVADTATGMETPA